MVRASETHDCKFATEVKRGGYYRPDGAHELHDYLAPANISEAANDENQGTQLWDFAEKATGLKYPF